MRVLLIALAALIAAMLLVWLHGSNARRIDATYHAGLAKTLLITSSSIPADGEIPPSFTCQGTGVSPELDWKSGPANAQSYAVVMTDFDVPAPYFALASFTHWIVYNIPAGQRQVQAAFTPSAPGQSVISVGENSTGVHGYQPPCPPLGTHRYAIRVYALDVARLKPPSDDAAAVLDSMRGHIIAYGALVGRVKH